jgi:hypothetical protein
VDRDAAFALEVGTTVITVTARDAAGLVGTDVPHGDAHRRRAPTVDITSPAAGATFSTTSTTVALAARRRTTSAFRR